RGRAAAGAAQSHAVVVGGAVGGGVIADRALLRSLQLAHVDRIGRLRTIGHVDHLAFGTGCTHRHRIGAVGDRARTHRHRVVCLRLRAVAQCGRVGPGRSGAGTARGGVGAGGGRIGQVVAVVGAEAAGNVGDVLDLLVGVGLGLIDGVVHAVLQLADVGRIVVVGAIGHVGDLALA